MCVLADETEARITGETTLILDLDGVQGVLVSGAHNCAPMRVRAFASNGRISPEDHPDSVCLR